jgi:uncharacterized protein YdhG (YjbR/CyaY superfamily)
MAEGKPAMTESKQSTRKTSAARSSAKVWTDEERAAMQESARERKAVSRRGPGDERAEGERDVLGKIAEMPEADRALAKRIHALVMTAAPSLAPRTYYGMPAYAKDGKVICFFQAASKFKVRYATFGFQPDASLDDGAMWPVAFALTKLTAADEARISALVKKAVS